MTKTLCLASKVILPIKIRRRMVNIKRVHTKMKKRYPVSVIGTPRPISIAHAVDILHASHVNIKSETEKHRKIWQIECRLCQQI